VEQLQAQLQKEHDQAVASVPPLKQALATAVQERDQALADAQTLRADLSASQQERDKISVEISVLRTQLQALKCDPQFSQTKETPRVIGVSTSPQRDDAAIALLVLSVIMGVVSYSKFRNSHGFPGERRNTFNVTSDSLSSSTVCVRMPRLWIKAYIQWARRMQSEAPKRSKHWWVGRLSIGRF
jgi:hypothetical protein